MQTFSVALLAVGAAASGYGYGDQGERARWGPTKEHGDYQHDRVWGHGHFEPGDIERFDNHYSEIYGADDLAWGPNGFQNPHVHNDDHHNWDDQGDAYVCHSCGGHGCTLCGGYGHGHRNAQFGEHGHTLKTGFGVGHNHVYLGDKPRSSYNRYGHGVGGRYTQRWSNGYGNRYGIGHGHRYGLAHRWSQYNGYGHGNPSSKGSVMGYGLGANAQIPQLWNIQEYDNYNDAVKYNPYAEPEYYEDEYAEPEYYEDEYAEPEYYEDEYAEPEYYEDEYAEPEYYEDEYAEPEYYEDEYAEPEYYEDEYAEPEYYEEEYAEPHYGCQTGCYVQDYYEPEYAEPEYAEPEYVEPEYEEPEYDEPYARGMGMRRRSRSSASHGFSDGWGTGQQSIPNGVGMGWDFPLSYGHGSGNHSPWNGEIWRHDAGMLNYRFRPPMRELYHTTPGYYNNSFF